VKIVNMFTTKITLLVTVRSTLNPEALHRLQHNRALLKPSCVDKLIDRGLQFSRVPRYKEDYTKLGVSSSATKEEIKAAYFDKAKKLHPDSSTTSDAESAEFYELNESYKRLMYESKYGTDEFDENDPRNDPRKVEYWQIRRRILTKEEKELEDKRNEKNRNIEAVIIRRASIGLALGIFFGTIFPAIFIGKDDYSEDPFAYTEGCQCDYCQLKKLEHSPAGAYLRGRGVVGIRSRELTSCQLKNK